MEELRQVMRFGGILAESQIDQVLSHYQEQWLDAMEHNLQIGKICNRISFISHGIIRSYAIDNNGDEVTKYFSRKQQFLVDLESFYEQKPAETACQAVVPSKIYYIGRSSWFQLMEEIPKFFILSKSLAEAALLNKIKDNDFLNFGTATDKYQEFLWRYPDLAQQVPQGMIASYLKITPQSLSRIRRRKL
ncbi:MAG: Crp/Fnr family transcriptional regulator [Bacteroidota bacterium]